MTLSRRLALSSASLLAVACAGPDVTAILRPGAPPRDRAAVLQTLLPGDNGPLLGARESPWHIVTDAPSTVTLRAGALVIASAPGRRAFAAPRLPVAAIEPIASRRHEELSWTASVTVDPNVRFFIICELRFAGEAGAVLFQATPFDVQVTQDSERPGGGSSVSLPRLIGDGGRHSWRLRLSEAGTQMLLNGSPIWTVDGQRALAWVAFGETRTDALHGGQMTLSDVVYVRRPALPQEVAWKE